MEAFLNRVVGWLRKRTKEQVVAAAALASLSAYALLYVAYFQFYTPFGLAPGDVGLTRVRLLEESLIGLLLVPVSGLQEKWIGMTEIVVAVVVVRVLLTLQPKFRPETRKKWLAELASTALIGFIALSGYLAVSGYVQLVHDARGLGNDVRRSGLIIDDWVYRRPNLYYPYLEIHAIPVDVEGAPLDLTITSGCTLYLGQSETQIVVFDVRRETVIRLPVGKVNLTLHPALQNYDNERLPARCTDDTGNHAG